MRPADIEQLTPTLESLATYGGVRAANVQVSWLREVGVAVEIPAGWMVPCSAWLEAVAPAHDSVDLLRRTAIRDPCYRSHLDFAIASVLSAIGIAERWRRFDELLQGPFLQFAPRFVQLLEWLERWHGKSCSRFDFADWENVEKVITGAEVRTFATWDQQLWGATGNTTSLFSLLQDLYVPLLKHPVHFNLPTLSLEQEADVLLRSLVDAVQRGEGVWANVDRTDVVDALVRAGVPARTYVGGGQATVVLVGGVSVSTTMQPASELYASRSFAIPEGALCSYLSDPTHDKRPPATFWECAESGQHGTGFLSLAHEVKAWPEAQPETPPWAQLPVAETLRGVALTRRESPDVDHALQDLANHLLFGFLLQVLLVEALDRELGDETLVLAPPTDRRVDDIEGATHIIYRPRQAANEGDVALRQESYDLGTLDLVFGELSKAIGIRSVAYAYRGSDLGPWSRALRIMRSAELVVGLYDRWSIAPHVLDRLHGGGMMTSVIRRGRLFRERLHSELHLMWTARRNAARVQAVQHG